MATKCLYYDLIMSVATLKLECFEPTVCCPTVEVTSNSYGGTFFPQVMGSYVISDEYQVSGRRVYVHTSQQFFIYLHDWGPESGMEWIIGTPQLGSPKFKRIISSNVEQAFPMNICLQDASGLGNYYICTSYT